LAKAYGCFAERVEKTTEFRAAFQRALSSPTGAVLDLQVAIEAITPNSTINELRASSSA